MFDDYISTSLQTDRILNEVFSVTPPKDHDPLADFEEEDDNDEEEEEDDNDPDDTAFLLPGLRQAP